MTEITHDSEKKYFELKFDYAGSGIFRCNVLTEEDAVKYLTSLLAEKDVQLVRVKEITEVDSLYPDGYVTPDAMRLN